MSGDDVAMRLGVDPTAGLSSAQAADLLSRDGPNELPAEKPVPGWRRFLGEFRTYMQLILLGAAVVSLVVQEWSTAVLLLFITMVNATVALRQEGKAESAMNALKSMVKPTARVLRNGRELEIPGEEIVVGDLLVLAAGDDVPADGRIIEAAALQIDESALTGESVPVAKDGETLADEELGAGDQTNMAFMHTPVTHGSGLAIVTATGARTQVGRIAGMLASTAREETPLTRQLNTLTLWIAAAAGLTMIVMFVLGAQRGESAKVLFTSAVALAIASIPEAMPTVLQVILSLGASDLAKRGAVVKDLASVETLGSTSAINSDKTGTLTMNQMTAVEVLDPDRPLHDLGYRLRPRRQGAARGRRVRHDRAGDPALHRRQRRQARGRQGRRRPHRGRAARARLQGGARPRGHARALPARRHAAVRPRLQADGGLLPHHRRDGRGHHPLQRQGRRAGRAEPGLEGALGRRGDRLGRRPAQPRRRQRQAHGRPAACA